MIEIGKYQTLVIVRHTSVGFFLADLKSGEEVLLPNKYLLDEMEEGGEVNVFVYKDTKDRIVATTEEPLVLLNNFAYLEVAQVNQVGAFLEWGLVEKQLMVPYKNQAKRMEVGKSYLIYLYKDKISDRLVATSRVDGFFKKNPANVLSRGDEVDLLVRGSGDLGMNVIVNQAYQGLVFANEIFKKLRPGDELSGYVKQVREDFKLDISLTPIGHASIEPGAAQILKELKKQQGFLPFTDKSDPEAIKRRFSMSKKLFKKSIGSLYKQKLVALKPDGIYLLDT